ncbi:MAG: putative DNA binding domain-containing protein [Lunatimonas sp.]|uniref:ATP-binding protein n=1 Tax=Lunatimonas sp. TaxID=2060141 RepID=UPI00263BCAB3|nr:ATP-binding protein [Lunatimonas sp.]MCC5938027.1 putative DNA binding domain-containing protein [Lunatimonas sp.]
MEDSFIIKNLLDQPEGERLELKAGIDYDAISKVITSFINTKGGDLVIGVNEDKSVSEIGIDESTKMKIMNFLIQEIRPIAPIFANIFPYKKKNVMLISVWEGAEKPYYFNNTIYIRQGSQTRTSSGKSISALLDQQVESEQRWERQAVLGASLDDLDIDEVQNSINTYRNYSSNEDFSNSEKFLISRGLIVNGNITNACMILFGKNPTQFIPQSIIKFVVHPGTTSGDSFKENKIYNGNLFSNVRKILSDFDTFIGKENVIEGVYRTEKKRYPEKALREGLLNAIVHREYGASQSFLVIELFSDRLVVRNYGGLQNNMTVNDLKTEHNSILRNPDIAQMCFYNNLIEMLGTGTLRMIRNCKEEGFKIPRWKNANNILELTFPDVKHQFEGITEGITKLAGEGISEGLIEGITGRVMESMIQIVLLILTEKSLRASEIAEKLDKSYKTLERHISLLKRLGVIEYKGSKRAGGYKVSERFMTKTGGYYIKE